MGDYDYELQENAAQHDLQDAGQLRADATTLHQEATTDFGQADAAQRMGAGDEAKLLHEAGDALEERSVEFDDRALLLEDSAAGSRQAAGVFRERDAATAGATAAEIHAQGAQVVLDFVDLNEQDKTRWTAEAGAATGEAAALHQRADDLTNQGVSMDAVANAERDAARAGLDGRQWPGVGHPPGDMPASGAE